MKSTINFGEALSRLKVQMGVSEDQEVAEALGLSKAAFSARKGRDSFPEKELRALLNERPELPIDVDYVLTGRQQKVAEGNATWSSASLTQETKVQLDVQQYFLVPQLSVHASAGNGYAVDAEDEIGRFAFRRDWLSKKVVNPDALRVITAKGRSMEPTVRDGDILLVDTSPQERLSDGIYVLNYQGESICKRLMRLLDGGLRICSDNATEFPPQDVPAGHMEQVHLVGKVIWVGGER